MRLPSATRLPVVSFWLLVFSISCSSEKTQAPSPVDTTPPAAVRTLAAAATGDSSVQLSWKAPGNDGMAGTAASYDIRFGTLPISLETWDSTRAVPSPPRPSLSGTPERMTIDHLDRGTRYYFALRSMDDSANLSALSNNAQAIPGVTTSDSSWWNGFVNQGLNENVFALAVDGGALVAGGWFTRAGNTSAERVARWDGTSWSAMGSGIGGPVYALAASGGMVYAGGDFTLADGSDATYVARWDGIGWSPVGDGFDAPVYALVEHAGQMIAGGEFTAIRKNSRWAHRPLGRLTMVLARRRDGQRRLCAHLGGRRPRRRR